MSPKIGIYGPSCVGKTTLITEAIKNKIPTWASFELVLVGVSAHSHPRFNNVLITSQKKYIKLKPLEMKHGRWNTWEDRLDYFLKLNSSFFYEGNQMKKYLRAPSHSRHTLELYQSSNSKNVLLLPPKDVYENRYLLDDRPKSRKPIMEKSYSKYEQKSKDGEFDLVIEENLSPKDLLDFIIKKFELEI